MEAGAEWAKVDMVRASYRLVWPHRTMILDTGYDEATARATGADSYDRSAWDRMQRALARCSLIAVTHEHGDHIGGLIASPELRDLLPQALLTPEQFRRIPGAKPQWPEDSRDGYIPMGYQGIMAIAPGVVLIRAAGHTPGSQMIYVRSASGHEYLFMGDTASLLSNVTHQHARSRLVTDFMTHDDRPAVLAQLAALHRLAAAEPGISLVPGHDADAIAALVRQGWLKRYFSLPPQR
jgi:glyoxylase-like metal-dependent hydrolase (beta-lactamase superfamily II)